MPIEQTSTKPRFYELDVTRAFAVLLLPLIHVFEEMVLTSASAGVTLNPPGFSLVELLNILAPSVFMILLGMNIAFSGEKTPAQYFKKGLFFYVLELALNVVRFMIPTIAYAIATKDLPFFLDYLKFMFISDIYAFVGLFFMLYALLKKLKLDDTRIFILALVVFIVQLVLDPVFKSGRIPYEKLRVFAGNFVHLDDDSCFPIVQWMIYPSFGILFGKFYRSLSEQDRTKYCRGQFFIGTLSVVAILLTLKRYDLNVTKILVAATNDYYSDFITVILMILVALNLIAFFNIVYYKFQNARIFKGLIKVSYMIIPFYMAQWIFVGLSEVAFVQDAIIKSPLISLFGLSLALCITVLSILLAKLSNDWFNEKIYKRFSR